MGFESWFSFESAKQRKKKQAVYYKKMFPLGEEQRIWEQEMMKKLFPEKKDVKPYIYELLVLKEGLFEADHPDEYEEDLIDRDTAIRIWKNSVTASVLTVKQQNIIQALALLEIEAKSMDSLPSKEDILEFARTIQ